MSNKRRFTLPILFKPYLFSRRLLTYDRAAYDRSANDQAAYDNGWHVAEPPSLSLINWRHSVCIIAREHYSEVQKQYPINNFDHLLKVIKAEARSLSLLSSSLANKKGLAKTIWAITRFKPGAWQVSFWTVPEYVIVELQGSFKFLVPESLLLSKALTTPGIYSIGDKSQGLFIYQQAQQKGKQQDVKRSPQEVTTETLVSASFVSVKRDNLIDSVERFCNLVNRYDLIDKAQSLSNQQANELLWQQLNVLPKYQMLGLMLTSPKTDVAGRQLKQWKNPIILAASIFVAYAISFSWHLSEKNTELDSQLQSKRGDMAQLIAVERKVSNLSQRLIAYQQQANSFPGPTAILNKLSNLHEKRLHERKKSHELNQQNKPTKPEDLQLTIEQLSITGSLVTIRAVAPSATKIFSYISEQGYAKSLAFSSAITEDRVTKLERFTLTFRYQQRESDLEAKSLATERVYE